VDNTLAKKSLRLFSYGLYIITSAADGDTGAFTANWVGQVSFDPRMVSVSVEQDAHGLQVIRSSGVFAVNVLDKTQRELAAQFSRPTAKVGSKLEGHEYTRGSIGCPLLPEALATVECRVVLEHPVGDHVLFVGEVVDAHLNREDEPLTMKDAGFKYSG
jgi:flavin reductase (DIM6/NTAB) family NADH-FMN oxidoreductase RutF